MITSNSDRHFMHMNVLLRHARGESGDSERDLETILTEAAIGKRRLWASGILFAELRPSLFVRERFPALADFVRYLRSIATFVTPDPNTMLRAGRLRDVQWQRPAALRRPGEKPRFLSLIDAIQIASALWVKEAAEVADLEFLAFDDRGPDDADAGGAYRCCASRIMPTTCRSIPMSSPRSGSTQVEPVLRSHAPLQSDPRGVSRRSDAIVRALSRAYRESGVPPR